MKLVKNIFKKDTLVEIAGITAGTLTADVVNTQVTPRILKSAQAQKFAPAIPLATGLVLSGSAKKFLKTTGYGMIANAMSSLAKTYLPQTVKSTVGIDGIGQVMMSGVDTPLMGTMDTDGFDYSAQPGGEMDY